MRSAVGGHAACQSYMKMQTCHILLRQNVMRTPRPVSYTHLRAHETAEGYLSVFYYEKEEFLEKCRAAYPDAGLTELTQIEIVSRDAAEYVTKIKVAGETYDGEQFRHALELPSACFTITEMDDHVRIVARGMGHGFGLSQNTAEKLAKEGYGYREILAYFYKGAVIGQAGNL